MPMKKLLLATAVSLVSVAASAENYQTEIGLSYTDFGPVDGFTIDGTYHFDEVDTSGKPLAEAAYLQNANNVSLAYTDIDGFDVTSIAAEFYINNFYIAPLYTNRSEGGASYAAAVGYATDNFRITTTVPEEDYELNVDVKYVTQLEGGNFINFEAGYADGGDFGEDAITIAGDYYFDETLSVGAIILNADDTDFGLSVDKFFTGTFRAGASVIFADEEIITLNASIRF